MLTKRALLEFLVIVSTFLSVYYEQEIIHRSRVIYLYGHVLQTDFQVYEFSD